MRHIAFASLAWLACLSLATQPASAQTPRQTWGYAPATSDSAAPPSGAPRVLRRAAAMVAMAESAPAAAPTILATRDAGAAEQAAAAAYQSALTSYSVGDRAGADSAARHAIDLAELAVTTAMARGSDLVQTASAGDVALAPPPAAPLAPVCITAATPAPTTASTSFADLRRYPFGTLPSEPVLRTQPDSLPFGATAVTRSPAPIAP